jgi:hypothetical protein
VSLAVDPVVNVVDSHVAEPNTLLHSDLVSWSGLNEDAAKRAGTPARARTTMGCGGRNSNANTLGLTGSRGSRLTESVFQGWSDGRYRKCSMLAGSALKETLGDRDARRGRGRGRQTAVDIRTAYALLRKRGSFPIRKP